jgi:hypothetical protein
VYNYHSWKGKVLCSQGKKPYKASSSGSNFRKVYVKKALIGKKNIAHCFEHCYKIVYAFINIFVYNSGTGRVSQKFQQIRIQQAQSNFLS